jgi:hypothetical protein
VKLQKHLNHSAGKSRNFLKNGQDLRSVSEQEILIFCPQKGGRKTNFQNEKNNFTRGLF